ncbi:hypothetical protein [Neisseria perflava]|jgi:hypothetical protein|uniref:hypothetical protein n=1 Tax=Neisseria perflava TaxID=33053 RepID=UPI0020466D67|nr:MAG TPA: hypothetical protein [Caudoviricetes sp.]DAT12095.1 MAG TPA: hypothetical protein [Caudoviricetes sp.]
MIYFDAFTAEREQFENFMTKNYYALKEDFEKDNRGSYVKEKAKFLYMGWLLSKQHKKKKAKKKARKKFCSTPPMPEGFYEQRALEKKE